MARKPQVGRPWVTAPAAGWSSMKRRRKMLRGKLYLLQRGRCFYCDVAMVLSPRHRNHNRACTVDHVRPQVHGGNWTPTNTVAACRRCNGHKGRRTALAYVGTWAPQRQAEQQPRMLAVRALIIRRFNTGALRL